jgi:hypothetical protein
MDMEQSNELKKLLEEKEELERKIKILQVGAVYGNDVKIDKVSYTYPCQRRMALYYRYNHLVPVKDSDTPMEKTRWVPFLSADNVDDVLAMIPVVISNLKQLYEKGTGTKIPLK